MGIEKFYKKLFKVSHWDDKEKAFHCNIDELINNMKQDMHCYQSCLGVMYFSSKEFTKEEIDEIEEEDKKTLDITVEGISKAIDKKIMEKLLQDNKWKKLIKNEI